MATPISLKRIQEQHRMAVDVFGDGTFMTDFLATKAGNRDLIKKFDEVRDSENWTAQIDGMTEYLAEVLSTWNLCAENEDGTYGAPLPINIENLDALGLIIQGKIFAGIMETFQAGEGNGSASTSRS